MIVVGSCYFLLTLLIPYDPNIDFVFPLRCLFVIFVDSFILPNLFFSNPTYCKNVAKDASVSSLLWVNVSRHVYVYVNITVWHFNGQRLFELLEICLSASGHNLLGSLVDAVLQVITPNY